jgi:hypothetical protein
MKFIGLVGLISTLNFSLVHAQEQFLNVTLDGVGSPSDFVNVVRFEPYFSRSGNPYCEVVIENETNYELYWADLTLVWKDSLGIPIASQEWSFEGEGSALVRDRVYNTIPPGTMGIFQGVAVPYGEEEMLTKIKQEAKTVSIALEWETIEESLVGDLDGDGDVDLQDFFLLADNFGKIASQAASKPVVGDKQ